MISPDISRILKCAYLDSLSCTELAYWLIESFTPERYRAGDNDVIQYACESLYKRMRSTIAAEFIERLWGMHGLEPDYAPNIFHENVLEFRRELGHTRKRC